MKLGADPAALVFEPLWRIVILDYEYE